MHEAENQYSKLMHEAENQHSKLMNEAENRHSKLMNEAENRHSKLMHEAENQYSKLMHEAENQHSKLMHEAENQHSKLMHEAENRHSKLMNEAEVSIASMTAERNQLTAEKNHLETQCKQLRGDLEWQRSTLDRCRVSVEYWKNLYNGAKSVLSAQGNAVSRAAAWEHEDVIQAKEVNWTTHTKLTRSQQIEVQKATATLVETTNELTTEFELYAPIDTFLSSLSIFKDRVKFLNTSQTRYLARQAPDFSICIPRVTKPHPALVHGVIEVKKRGEDVNTAKHLGQLKEYMLNLMSAQCDRGRRSFWGFLTNMETNILIEITEHRRSDYPIRRVTQYPPMEWTEMVRYIYSVCQKDAWIPPTLHFRDTLGSLVDLIACNSKWHLGEFKSSIGTQPQSMVVKVSTGAQPGQSHRHELNVLRHIRKLGNQPTSIVKLVWDPAGDGSGEHPERRIEFGLSPRGKRFSLANFSKRGEADTAFREIVNGIFWLHTTARIIHRDIRRDNIILNQGRPIIIDFDCSYNLNGNIREQATITTYAGGLICVPNHVVKKAINEIEIGGGGQVQTMGYKPEESDDLFAFVILVIALLFPTQFDRFPVQRMNWSRVGLPQLQEMDRFHEECTDWEGWGKWWDCAKNSDYEGLKGIGKVCQFPSD